VRIERGPLGSGTGVVIVNRDEYAVVLTAKHVLEGPQAFSVVFHAAPERAIAVSWTGETVFGFPDDSDLALFRVDGPIPDGVLAEDPFTAGVPVRASVTAWGYPASRNGSLCSFSAPLADIAAGRLIAGVYVPEGVSGGPVFYQDPADGMSKLAGIVSGGDGTEQNGTTSSIDIRQAVAIVETSNDPRNNRRPHVWPNIVLPPAMVDGGRSFIRIAGGPLTLGSNDNDDEKPRHEVEVPVFYMGEHEVTVGQFAECVKAGACTHSQPGLASARTDHPVVGVSWDDAMAYAEWLRGRLARGTDATLRRLLNARWQVDLPNEAEWEKSARRSGTGAFPWGDGFNPSAANYETGQLRVVGQTRCEQCDPPLADMAGNVREWTRSLKRPYPYVASLAENRADRNRRAVRGGSFRRLSIPTFGAAARAANRQDEQPAYSDAYTGFRVALICLAERGCSWKDPNQR
jgi:formylglycine-generating enzyme required for sulfatase activity